jgi:hypothetical protein
VVRNLLEQAGASDSGWRRAAVAPRRQPPASLEADGFLH